MPCKDRDSYHEAALIVAVDRQKVAIERLGWIARKFENPDLLKVSGNEKILERREQAKRNSQYNSITYAELEAYTADYQESRLCAAIKAVDDSRLLELLTSELATSKFCRNFLDWYEEHKTEDAQRLEDEKVYWTAKISELEFQLETAKSELKKLG